MDVLSMLAHACSAVMAGAASAGGGANVSILLTVIVALTGVALVITAWPLPARPHLPAWLLPARPHPDRPARAASPSAPTMTYILRCRMCFPLPGAGRIPGHSPLCGNDRHRACQAGRRSRSPV